ncbi:hypothetical protein D5018_02515 [Parashewanella curva]|uniref:Uncharacterized protein n=2 Tax=Parashewanella curva TaxID=2338552 RepID=A0A3L8Q2V0_9GAMM|nr:hypothetical protein D5018_02515 [Parashewanella curva]
MEQLTQSDHVTEIVTTPISSNSKTETNTLTFEKKPQPASENPRPEFEYEAKHQQSSPQLARYMKEESVSHAIVTNTEPKPKLTVTPPSSQICLERSIPQSLQIKYEFTLIFQEITKLEREYNVLASLSSKLPDHTIKERAVNLVIRYITVSKKHYDFLQKSPETLTLLTSMPDVQFQTPSEFGLYLSHVNVCQSILGQVNCIGRDFSLDSEISGAFICFYCRPYCSECSADDEVEATIFEALTQFTPINWLKYQFDLLNILQGSRTVRLLPKFERISLEEFNISDPEIYKVTYLFIAAQAQFIRRSYSKLYIQSQGKAEERLLQDIAKIKEGVTVSPTLFTLFESTQHFIFNGDFESESNKTTFIEECLWFLHYFCDSFQIIQPLHQLHRRPSGMLTNNGVLCWSLSYHINFLAEQTTSWPKQHPHLTLLIHWLKDKVMAEQAPVNSHLWRLQYHLEQLCKSHPFFNDKCQQALPSYPRKRQLKQIEKPFPETPIKLPSNPSTLMFQADTALRHLLKNMVFFESRESFTQQEVNRQLTLLSKNDLLAAKHIEVARAKGRNLVKIVQWYDNYLDCNAFERFILTEPSLKVSPKLQDTFDTHMKAHHRLLSARRSLLMSKHDPDKDSDKLLSLSREIAQCRMQGSLSKKIKEQSQQLLQTFEQCNSNLVKVVQTDILMAYSGRFQNLPTTTEAGLLSCTAATAFIAIQKRATVMQVLLMGTNFKKNEEYSLYREQLIHQVQHGNLHQLSYLIFDVWPQSTSFSSENHQPLVLLKIMFAPDDFLNHLKSLDAIEYLQYTHSYYTIPLCLILNEQYEAHCKALIKCPTLADFEFHQQRLLAIEHTITKGWLHKHIYADTILGNLNIDLCNQLLTLIIEFPQDEVLKHHAELSEALQIKRQESLTFEASLPSPPKKEPCVTKKSVFMPRKPQNEERESPKAPIPEVISEADQLLMPIEKMSTSEPQQAIDKFSKILTEHSSKTEVCIRARISKAHAAMLLVSPTLDKLLLFQKKTLDFNQGFRDAIATHKQDLDTKITHPNPDLFSYMVDHCISRMPILADELVGGIQKAQFHLAEIDEIPPDMTHDLDNLALCCKEVREVEQKIKQSLLLIRQFDELLLLRTEFNAYLKCYRDNHREEIKIKSRNQIKNSGEKYDEFAEKIDILRRAFSEFQGTCHTMMRNTD